MRIRRKLIPKIRFIMSGAGFLVGVVCFDADLVEAGELHNDIMIEAAISAESVVMKIPAYGLNEFDQTIECLIRVQFGKLITRICSHHGDTILFPADLGGPGDPGILRKVFCRFSEEGGHSASHPWPLQGSLSSDLSIFCPRVS